MTGTARLTACVITVFTLASCVYAADVDLMGFRLVPISGLTASTEEVPGADNGLEVLRLTFSKAGEERRFLGLEAIPEGSLEGMKALVMRYRLTLAKGDAPRPAVVLFDGDGGCWYKVAGYSLEPGGFRESRMSIISLRPTAFSDDKSGQLEWGQVTKVWVGVVLDGAAEGVLEGTWVRFTDAPYRPTTPIRLLGSGPGQWSAAQDPAVKSTIGTSGEGPNGEACMKYEFTVPAGRHMYALPNAPVMATELDGYGALRFKYRARIPEGMRLLVTLSERGGGGWYVEPPGPWPDEWTEITLPLANFREAGWAKDPNGKFDVDQIGTITIGTHGVPKEGGPGQIMATDIEFVP